MDKQLARRNMRMGSVLFLVLLLMLGITFIWASLYINTIGS
jgi:hypothetical protein